MDLLTLRSDGVSVMLSFGVYKSYSSGYNMSVNGITHRCVAQFEVMLVRVVDICALLHE
jgi:hypothetical protein